MGRKTYMYLLSAVLLLSVGLVGCDRMTSPTGPQPDRNVSDPADSRQQPASVSQNRAGEKVDGQYIVVFSDEVQDPSQRVEELTGEVAIEDVRHIYEEALKGFAGAMSASAAEGLANRPDVAYVEQDQTVTAFSQTLPTGVDRIQVDKNSTASIDGTASDVAVDIAILDTGIDLDHPDLYVEKSTDCTGGGPMNSSCTDGEGDDGNGHGTHVAGTAAALDNGEGVVGVAPGADLWAVKVLKDDGSGWMSDIIAGVDWVTGHAGEIDVANMSLGASGTWSQSLRDAIQRSVNEGILYAVAAGNDSAEIYGGDGSIGDGNEVIPAAYPEVAAISAMADSDGASGGDGSDTSYGSDDSFASFSNFSEHLVSDSDNPDTSPGAAVDLLLPGVEIYSTYADGGYNTLSGTSMASPHAAGLAALYIAENGSATDASGVTSIRQALIDRGVKQSSSSGLAVQNDPDDNRERIGWADTGAPSVSWVNPADGQEVSGTVAIDIDASDESDSKSDLTVEWRVDGGTWRTASDSDDDEYFDDEWDSTTLSDGEHVLDTRATDSDGNSSTASITVTTENTDDAPEAAWVNPSDGETVSGSVTIQIDASDDRDSGSDLTVEWQVDDGTWRSASYNSTSGYYEDTWNSENVADGDHNLDARATDTGGNIGKEKRITVTVSNSSGGMYVWDISFRETGPHLKATVTVRRDSDSDGTAESSDEAVSDAAVDFTLTNTDTNESNSYTGTTDSNGQVEFQWKQAPSGTYEAEVIDITHSSYSYNSTLDQDNPDSYTK